jgi:hypothetical protein
MRPHCSVDFRSTSRVSTFRGCNRIRHRGSQPRVAVLPVAQALLPVRSAFTQECRNSRGRSRPGGTGATFKVTIPWQSRGLYDWGPSKGPRNNPSSGFVPQPPSPQGRRKTIPFPSLRGRGWTAPRAFPGGRGPGEGSWPKTPLPSPRLLLEMSNFYCHPGRAGGSPK